MALERYRAKRDFAKTSEPAGRAAAGKKGRRFAIQKHAALSPQAPPTTSRVRVRHMTARAGSAREHGAASTWAAEPIGGITMTHERKNDREREFGRGLEEATPQR